MSLEDHEISEILKYVNNEGAKGKRLICFQNKGYNATGTFWDGLTLVFDKGPQKATDTPWPK